jgi:large subunit ribosomal protein L20
MPRVRKGAARTQARKRILRLARGYYGVKSKHKYQAENALMRAGVYQFRDRRRLKRDMRRLWITRVTAACRMRGTRYSLFINGLKLSGILLNRKMLSQLAIEDPKVFDRLVETANAALKAKPAAPKFTPNWGGAHVAKAAGSDGLTPSINDIEDIEGIGPKFASMLLKAGVKNVNGLLQAGKSPAGRAAVAQKSGLKLESVTAWVKQADLLRVPGVSPDWAELMIASGVDSVKELANRDAGNLRSAMEKTNNSGAKLISPDMPSADQVGGFIAKAKTMPAVYEA